MNDGLLDGQLPDDESRQETGRQHGQRDDEAASEPVLFLAFVQHDLQRAHAHRQHAETPKVGAQLAAAQVGRIGNKQADHDQAGDADGEVDIEDPAPRIGVSNPPAERGAKYGRGDNAHPPKRHGLAALRAREFLQQHSLGKRLEPSPGGALEHAKENQRRQIRGNPAQKARDREPRHHGQQQSLAPEVVRQPAGDGQDDGVGDQVRGEYPGGFIDRGRKAARNVRQADVDHRSVQHLHHRAGHHRHRHQPTTRRGLGDYCAVHIREEILTLAECHSTRLAKER